MSEQEEQKAWTLQKIEIGDVEERVVVLRGQLIADIGLLSQGFTEELCCLKRSGMVFGPEMDVHDSISTLDSNLLEVFNFFGLP